MSCDDDVRSLVSPLLLLLLLLSPSRDTLLLCSRLRSLASNGTLES